jgi:hypothetical protein
MTPNYLCLHAQGRCHMPICQYVIVIELDTTLDYVTCIPTIDTIILTNYTNNAYIFDTHTPLYGIGGHLLAHLVTCIIIIDTFILAKYTNNAYIYLILTPLRRPSPSTPRTEPPLVIHLLTPRRPQKCR